ncbi:MULTISPECIES: hypothetical protein [Gilliamella]|uniref:Lipoprotein n=1 Tax=Gilliamella apis TaxID=1970738 RepID=A0A242NY10_9GAMM|nr:MULTISPECIES: hypothetical protein [Gilliamella]MBI0155183.1 hypothetical protein [Gilliamella sp. W8128]OTQ34314.1 hypothetical protein B6C84_10090 [Gilliamella apis]OTQ38556.1 hypothetical protein B6C88_00075 [Gilliamella apis]OTQ39503.1 hypothetical protein B6D26_08605 [Gilliamella apis]OTQ43062.1 hypothetical protein B6C94_04650 [Gilliamella apis]
MRILGYSFSLLATVILLTGCIYGDIDKRQRDFITIEAARYCEANHYSYCEIYAQCYRDFLEQMPAMTDSLSAFWGMSRDYLDDKEAPKEMDNIYAQIKDNEKKGREDLSLDYSYLLFPHNRCSSIINAKQYDISNYQEAIDKGIKSYKLYNE